MSAKSSFAVLGSFLPCLLLVCGLAIAMIGCKAEEPSDGAGAGGCPAPAAGMAAPAPINGVPGCEAAVAGTPAQLHADALAVLNSAATCGFSSCHNPNVHKANLVLLDAPDLASLLVDKPSCEAPTVPLVKSGCGDAALQNSWLWLKLVAPADANGNIIPDAAWGTPVTTCNQLTPAEGPLGTRMPQGSGAGVAGESRLGPIRNWICAGSPGPM